MEACVVCVLDGQWYRENRQNPSQLDNKLQEWVRKHQEDKKNARNKEIEFKRRLELNDLRRGVGALEDSSKGVASAAVAAVSESNSKSSGEELSNLGGSSRRQSIESEAGLSQPKVSSWLSVGPFPKAKSQMDHFGSMCCLFDDLLGAKEVLHKKLTNGMAVVDEPDMKKSLNGFLVELQKKFGGVLSPEVVQSKTVEVLQLEGLAVAAGGVSKLFKPL